MSYNPRESQLDITEHISTLDLDSNSHEVYRPRSIDNKTHSKIVDRNF